MASKVRRRIGEGFLLQPKFYKIILSQHECNSLKIPEDFVRRYCKNMLNPVYLEVPSGEVWEVEVKHSQGQIWLAKGWQDFCECYSISCGHFLMFGYNARSHFNVTIFDLSAAEIEYPYSIHIFHCHETHHAPKSDLSELDDSVDIIEGVQRSPKLTEKVPGMFEHPFENLGHAQSSKRKRHDEDLALPSFTRKSQKSKDCGVHKQQSKSVYDQNKTVKNKESTIAYRNAKAFKSKNPFIISFMQPSYVSAPFNLSIASKFARKHFLENDANLVLRVPGSGSWSVKCAFGIANAKIGYGWKAFVLDNKLKVGDVCVFEVIKDAQLFVDVTIFRAAGSTPMHNIVGEEPGGSDSKSKVIKIDNSVPCSQPKVVQTKKLKHQAGSSYGFNSKIKEEHGQDTEIMHSAKILGHCPLGHGSKRKRPEGEAEDDASIDVHTKSLKVEMSQDVVASPSFTRKPKRSGESCRMRKQQTEMVYGKEMKVLDKERTIAYERAKAFKSKNPFVIYFMQPSYVSKPYNLNISFLIAWKCFREKCGNVVLHVPGRGSWSVKYVLGMSEPTIRFTWKAFVLDNKLQIGDVCVFELIKGAQPFVDVTIFRAAERKPMHKINGGVSDCKNKIINTENSVPSSQPKIFHSKKLNLEKKQNGDSDGFTTSKIKEELGEGTVRHMQQSKSSCKGTVVAKEMVMAYQKAKAFTSKNPFFISFMQPSYVSQARGPMQLTIMGSVARKFFPAKHSDVVLQVSSKRRWTVKCTVGMSNGKFSAGWKEFVLDNNLKVGDVCVFERAGRSKFLFNVIIFPSAEVV